MAAGRKQKLLRSNILPTRLYKLLSIFLIKERTFLMIVMLCFVTAAFATPYPQVAMWVGFLFAAYSATANDSIQTIGTFLVSNLQRKWYVLWAYIAAIFVVTAVYSWWAYGGDVSYQRLQTPGLDEAPHQFEFLQIAAPIFLLILTRMRMPVSTTFLLLSIFSTKASGILGMLEKSAFGYLIAFGTSILIYTLLSGLLKRMLRGEAHPAWVVAQWLSSGALWAVWIMQDAANIAVFLPRSLEFWQLLLFLVVFVAGIGLLFFMKGDRIQEIVNEKTAVTDVRSATVIDFVYAVILFVFKNMSNVPMSTTWVFIGLLAGREIGMHVMTPSTHRKPLSKLLQMVGKDIMLALIGLVVSIILAVSINPNLKRELIQALGL